MCAWQRQCGQGYGKIVVMANNHISMTTDQKPTVWCLHWHVTDPVAKKLHLNTIQLQQQIRNAARKKAFS